MGKRAPAVPVSEAEKLLAEDVFQTKPQQKKNKRKQLGKSEQQDKASFKLKAAWVDEDDEDVEVNLEEQPQLRKLRKTEKDTVVDGKELNRRLKTLYARLLIGSAICVSIDAMFYVFTFYFIIYLFVAATSQHMVPCLGPTRRTSWATIRWTQMTVTMKRRRSSSVAPARC